MPKQKAISERSKKTAWQRQRKALQGSGLGTLGELVDALRKHPLPRALKALPPSDVTEMLVDLGLAAVPLGQTFKAAVLEKINGNATPSLQQVFGAFNALSEQDVDERCAALLAESKRLLETSTAGKAFRRGTTLARHPVTAHAFARPTYAALAERLKFSSQAIDKLVQKFPSDAVLAAAEAGFIAKAAGAAQAVVKKLQISLCYLEAFDVPIDVAIYIAEHFPNPLDLLGPTPYEIRDTLDGLSPKYLNLTKIRQWIETVRIRFPEESYFRELLADLVPDAARKELQELGISTVRDLRRAAPAKLTKKEARPISALEYLVKTRVLTGTRAVAALRAHARLERLSRNFALNKAMVGRKLVSAAHIARLPVSRFKSEFRRWAASRELEKVHLRARGRQPRAAAFETLRNLAVRAPRLDRAIHFRGQPEVHMAFAMAMRSASATPVYQSACECGRCEAVFSPVAYLSALVRFIEYYFSTTAQQRGLDYLVGRTYRLELLTVDLGCDVIESQLPQPEIASRVLLNYIIDHSAGFALPATLEGATLAQAYADFADVDEMAFTDLLPDSVNPPPFYYYGTQLKEYLTALGTSLGGVHSVFEDPEQAGYSAERLAELLGITTPELERITAGTALSWAEMAVLLGIQESALTAAVAGEDAAALKHLLGLPADGAALDVLDALLATSLFVGGATLADIDEADASTMIRIVLLTQALGRSVREAIALIELATPADLALAQVQDLFEKDLMLRELGLEPSELARLLGGADRDRVLSARLHVSAELLPEILSSMVVSEAGALDIEGLHEVWQLLIQIRALRLNVQAFVRLPDALADASSHDALASSLGVSAEEITETLGDPAAVDFEEALAELMGVSADELTLLLEDFGVEHEDEVLDTAEKIDSPGALDALYRPVRIARLLGLNIEELRALATEGVMRELDLGAPQPSQIVIAARIVQMAKVLGLRLARIPDAIDSSTSEELGLRLQNDVGWWGQFSGAAMSSDERFAALAQIMAVAVSDLENLVEQLSGARNAGWLAADYRHTDQVRHWVELARQLGMSAFACHEMLGGFVPAVALGDVDSFYKVCALAIERRYLGRINAAQADRALPGELIGQADWLAAPAFADIDSIAKVERLHQLATLTASLDLTATELAAFDLWQEDVDADDVTALTDLLKARFADEEQYKREVKKPEDRILLATRDALRDYAISAEFRAGDADAPRTVKALAEELLVDLQFATCMTTSLVLQAIESLQTFVERVRTGLEKEDDGSGTLVELKQLMSDAGGEELWQAMERDWRWYGRHVLWEAAQKVYVYPENYTLPQLRDDKTEIFREFEDLLSQGEVTQDLAEKALKGYLEALHPLSALRVSGTWYDSKGDLLHVFARSQVDEVKTYYRVLRDRLEWEPWKLLPFEVNAAQVVARVSHGRLYVFWVEAESEKGEDPEKDYDANGRFGSIETFKDHSQAFKHKHTIYYAYTTEADKWSKPKKVGQIDTPTLEFPHWDVFVSDDRVVVRTTQPQHPIQPFWMNDSIRPLGSVFEEEYVAPHWRPLGVDYGISCSDSIHSSRSDDFAHDREAAWLPGQRASTQFFLSGYQHYSEAFHIQDNFFKLPFSRLYFRRPNSYTLAWATWDGPSPFPTPGLVEYPIRGPNRAGGIIDHEGGLFVLFVDEGGLHYLVTTVPERRDTLNPRSREFVAEAENRGIVLQRVDDSFRIDSTLKIGDRYYFFCSDMSRCLLLIGKVEPDICDRRQLKFSICQLSYGKYCALADRLFKEGLDALYEPSLQVADLEKDFNEQYAPTPRVEMVPPRKLEFCGPNKIYNWEMFFHSAYLLADSLGQNRKFELAAKWYRHIMDPYADPQPSDTDTAPRVDVTWIFAPFRSEYIEQIQNVLSAADDLQAWHRDPFSPHRVARVRPGTYQKAVLLSYVDCLLQWADQDFTDDTRESMNRARNRYLLVQQLLGVAELEALPPCHHQKRTLEDLLGYEWTNEDESDLPELDFAGCCLPLDWLDEPPATAPGSLLARLEAGCVPENPLFESHWRHVESNLRKIRACRNIAGIQRILPLFDAAVDPLAIVRAVSSGAGLENINLNAGAAGIGPYRFAYLIERAKVLAQLVAQTGNALLLAIEKKESEELAFIRAQQELKLSKAQVHLRKLHVSEAEDGVALAALQTGRANFQMNHFVGLIAKGKNEFEEQSLDFLLHAQIAMGLAATLHVTAAVASMVPTTSTGSTGTSVSFGGSNVAGMLSGLAAAASTTAGILSTQSQVASMNASFERREEEWEFQRDLAQKEIAIAQQAEAIAQDRLAISQFEQQIAEMQAEFADQTLQFLKEKFTNKELYKWMVKVLSKVLYGFYNLAYTTARMAQATMEFERNETQSFISYTYWDSEKKGLLSGDQLLLDIARMDQAYIERNHRKLEVTRHISIGRMAPEALAELKREGKTIFATPMSWFDRDFPGHYQRVIKSVRLSVLALVPPGANVHATLSTVSPSLVMLHPEDEAPVQVPRIQSVALSGASNSSGLFELSYRDERYLPFEGCGVAATWELEMPKASNRFNFDSLVDVMLTVDYTALSDSELKQRVIEQLGDDAGGMLPLTVRSTFPDAWYHFHNPVFELETEQRPSQRPYTLALSVRRAMFPPNEDGHKLTGAALLVNLANPALRLPLKIRYESDRGEVVQARRETGEGGYLSLESLFADAAPSPFGEWLITVDRSRAPDSLLAKDEDGVPLTETSTSPPEARNLLDTDQITDVILSMSYSAKLAWPAN